MKASILYEVFAAMDEATKILRYGDSIMNLMRAGDRLSSAGIALKRALDAENLSVTVEKDSVQPKEQ